MNKIVLVSFSALVIAFLLASIRFGWAGQLYGRSKNDRWAWYWLDVFNIPRSRENCVRFAKGISWVAVVFVVVLSTCIFIWGS